MSFRPFDVDSHIGKFKSIRWISDRWMMKFGLKDFLVTVSLFVVIIRISLFLSQICMWGIENYICSIKELESLMWITDQFYYVWRSENDSEKKITIISVGKRKSYINLREMCGLCYTTGTMLPIELKICIFTKFYLLYTDSAKVCNEIHDKCSLRFRFTQAIRHKLGSSTKFGLPKTAQQGRSQLPQANESISI